MTCDATSWADVPRDEAAAIRLREAPRVRALRGATTVARDEAPLVHEAVCELLVELMRCNDLEPDDVVSVVFTATEDLRSTFPARGARELDGWSDVPMLCARELDIEAALPRCLRVLLHAETSRRRDESVHVYLRDAACLRPDLAST